jgi:hypothetical protein
LTLMVVEMDGSLIFSLAAKRGDCYAPN